MSETGCIRTILGTMVFGGQVKEAQCHEILKEWVNMGYNEVDTAIMYQKGNTEKIIGKLHLCRDPSKVAIACKANPTLGLSAEGVVKQLNASLENLQIPSCEIFYLHAPDRKVPIEDTLRGVDQLHKEGKFKIFGLSNYKSWEVMEVYHVCKSNGYVLPSVYQGMYNAITRDVEIELFACLRKLGIRFYAYNALAGGLLTGRYSYEDVDNNQIPFGRFQGFNYDSMYRKRYWKKTIFDSVEVIKAALKKTYGDDVGIFEASIRWLYNHSMLSRENSDGVIIGFSKLDHMTSNLAASKAGPLHDDVVAAFDEAWDMIRSKSATYWR